jgi:para-aminobenzoate synthetase / 4-amino-4-deoxychorismate lyase
MARQGRAAHEGAVLSRPSESFNGREANSVDFRADLRSPEPMALPAAAEPVQATFCSFHPLVPGWSCSLSGPTSVLEATTLQDVVPLLHTAWRASLSGKWVALLLSYEAAPAFDPAMITHPPGEFPLAWAAVFDRPLDDPGAGLPEVQDVTVTSTPYAVGPWTPLVERQEYDRSIGRIHELIVQGETYQVNYTMPFRASFSGDEHAWYMDLARAQGAPFSAYLRMGRFSVLSLSPELFFRQEGREIVSMPMKGTMARGRWPGEDRRKADALAACPKNRAENVMIVDLVRSDLGRIAVPGSVRAEPLFEVQTFRSVHQMVSTVGATLPKGATLIDVMRALFPGGSITGAPKIRTMEIIRDLEPIRGISTPVPWGSSVPEAAGCSASRSGPCSWTGSPRQRRCASAEGSRPGRHRAGNTRSAGSRWLF